MKTIEVSILLAAICLVVATFYAGVDANAAASASAGGAAAAAASSGGSGGHHEHHHPSYYGHHSEHPHYGHHSEHPHYGSHYGSHQPSHYNQQPMFMPQQPAIIQQLITPRKRGGLFRRKKQPQVQFAPVAPIGYTPSGAYQQY